MRFGRILWGAAFLAAAVLSCNGDDGGTTPTPPSGGGAGVWVADKDATVNKFSHAGAPLAAASGFEWPVDVSVRQADGVAWVADTNGGSVTKVSDTGSTLKKVTAPFSAPCAVSVNESDGSCWVADRDGHRVYRLDANGDVQVNKGGFNTPADVSCYAGDGACWVVDGGNDRVVKLGADGSRKFDRRVMAPVAVAVDERNGGCWVACFTTVVKYSASGNKERELTGFSGIYGLAVSPSDGSVVVADEKRVVKYDASGNRKWQKGGFTFAFRVDINKDDGSDWVSDVVAKKVVKLSSGGEQLLTISTGLSIPTGVDVRY